MTAVESDRPAVDLLDPFLYQRNPHDVWAWMRANEPVYHDDRNGLWAVTRHADLMDVERRSTVFLSGQGYRALWSPEEINMIAQDDPRHRQQRMLVQPKLTGKSVAQRQAEIAALVTELIDDALAAGATVESVLNDSPEKIRDDEAQLAKEHRARPPPPPPLSDDPPDDPPSTKPTPPVAPPIDSALQRAVHLHRALKALKKL